MELSEDELIQIYAKHCGLCGRNTILPYKHEFTCVSCGYNVIKRKHELSKIQRKKLNFINRFKNADHKILCICVGVYKIYEGDDFDEIYEVLSTLKTEKLKKNKILNEKFQEMLENPNFEQNKYSLTSTGLYNFCP